MPVLPLSTITTLAPPDFKQAVDFLNLLDPNAATFLFVLVHRDGGLPSISRQPVNENTLLSLAAKNSDGWNIYVTVNETGAGSGTSRTKEDISRLRCVFLDDDAKQEIPGFPIAPSAVIETSPGKRQVFFMLNPENINHDQWNEVQQCLVNMGGDKNARDIARILRVPGFYNVKLDYEVPHMAALTTLNQYYYSWNQVVAAFPPAPVITSTGRAVGESLNIKETLEQFVSGENYHDAGIALAGYWYNKGIHRPEELIAALQDQMDVNGNTGDPRFQHRRNKDIPESVAWIIKERKKEIGYTPEYKEIEYTTDKASPYTTLPEPGGGMWHIYRWVNSIFRYRNDTMAIFMAEHIVAVFGGGHWALENNTTTRKRILLSVTGSGKGNISRAMSKVVKELTLPHKDGNLPAVMEAGKFIGSDSFSFKVQQQEIEEHRVRGIVVPEAGEGKKSSAGDIGTLSAYHLEVLSIKANDSYNPKKHVDAESRAKEVYDGVWVFFHESVPESYITALQSEGAFVSGDLARSDLVFSNPELGDKNPVEHSKMPEMVKDIITVMANDFRSTESRGDKIPVNGDRFEEIDISIIKTELDKYEEEVRQRRNKINSGDNPVMRSILSRTVEKVFGTILILATADAALEAVQMKEEKMARPVATMNHFKYALEREKRLQETLIYHSTDGLLGDPFALVKTRVIKALKTGETRISGINPVENIYGKLQYQVSMAWMRERITGYRLKPVIDSGKYMNVPAARRAFIIENTGDGEIFQPVRDSSGSISKDYWWLNLKYIDPEKSPLKGSRHKGASK